MMTKLALTNLAEVQVIQSNFANYRASLKARKTSQGKALSIEIGEQFGLLTVTGKAKDEVLSNGKMTFRKMWEVRCECGSKFIASGSKLRRGDTVMCKSCAFKLRPQSIVKYYPIERIFQRMVVLPSKRRKIEVSLTVGEFEAIIFADCYYCGCSPKPRNYYLKDAFVTVNGVDRKDSAIGYRKDNCVPCCINCNMAKGVRNEHEFLNHIKKIYEFRLLPCRPSRIQYPPPNP